MRKLRPNAQILVIGPSDMSTKIDGLYQSYPLLEYYIEKIKEAVKTENAAYWDIYKAMGGENSMVAWVKNTVGCQRLHPFFKNWNKKDYKIVI